MLKQKIKSRIAYLRFDILMSIAKIILPRYRFKNPYMAWWDDPVFNRYLKKFDLLRGKETDRRWMLYQLLRLTQAVPGDTVECGVFKGSSSYLICKYNQESKNHRKNHYIFDSFEGLSAPSEIDGKFWYKGTFACQMDEVKANMAEFPHVSFHKGWIPERFDDVKDKKFSFIHIDVDLYQPTGDSMKFFYPRVNPGGIMLCDDYGFSNCPGATQAVDEFLSDKPEKMMAMSCGGGFMIKGLQTAKPCGL